MIAVLARLWKTLPYWLRQSLLFLWQPTYTLGISAVTLDDQGRVLLFRHRLRPSTGWELPGGFVGRNETMEAAVRRELREEAGLTVEIVRQLHARVGSPYHVDVVYLVRVTGGELRIDDMEIVEGKFFPVQSLPPGADRTSRWAVALAMAPPDGPLAPLTLKPATEGPAYGGQGEGESGTPLPP